MNTFWLQEFVVLADTCNYQEAAERLFIGQSTLSKNICALEKELGVSLFERSTRRVTLSPAGKILLPYASRAAEEILSLKAAARNISEALQGKVIIYTLPAMPQYGITDIISQFQWKYPQYRIGISTNITTDAYEALRSGGCELAFIREVQGSQWEQDIVKRRFLSKDDLVAVLPKNHPLGKQELIHLEQLHDETFVSLEETGIPYELMLSVCQKAGFLPRIAFTCNQVGSVLDLVTQGSGVALLMRGHTNRPKQGNFGMTQPFLVRPVVPSIRTDIFLCYVAHRPLSPAAQAFLDIALS